VKVPKALGWDSYADPKRNTVNIGDVLNN